MSLYNRLTQRDAPVAGPNPNMTPMTRKPMSLRDAVQKYARGGNVDVGDQSGIEPSNIADILRMAQQQPLSPEQLVGRLMDPRPNPEVGYGEMDSRTSPEPQIPRKDMAPLIDQRPNPEVGYGEMDRRTAPEPPMDPRTSPDRPMEPQQDPRQIPDPYGEYTPVTRQDPREDLTMKVQQAISGTADRAVTLQDLQSQFPTVPAQTLAAIKADFERQKQEARDRWYAANPQAAQPSQQPGQNYWQNPQEPMPQQVAPPQQQYAVPPQEQYAVAPPRIEPTRPIPTPVNETGWTEATRPAAQPQSTNWVQSILGGPGLGTGMPGSAQAPAQNSLDAMINMLQQRNKQ